jgi:ferredoxin
MPKVTVVPENVSAEVPPGTLLMDGGEQAGVIMNAGCFGCACGSCMVEVIRGMENLDPVTLEEASVLYQRHKDASKYRLACCVRIQRGEVVIRGAY